MIDCTMNQTNFWNDAAKCGAVIGGIWAASSLLSDATGLGVFGLIGFAMYLWLLIRYARRRLRHSPRPTRSTVTASGWDSSWP